MSGIKVDFKVELWPIEQLIPYELNVKKHEKAQVAKIAEAIKKHGWDVPIVVDRDGVIIKGHGRRLAALTLGLEKVPVLQRKDLTPAQVKAARLADNRVAISDIDPEMLRAELAGIEDELKGIFDDKEMDFMAADLGTMNTDAFVEDMDQVLEDQAASIESKVEAAASSELPIAKVFGFAKIPAAGQIAITTMMAKAEAATGLKNAEALVAWAASLQ
jgi:hypothetical protein